jgi:lipoyl-dependent peroxiredoxin
MEQPMTPLDKVLYTAKTHTTGGREGGVARSNDGRLEVRLSPPGTAGGGTNPEQLFAAGWSACFISAMKVAAARMKVALSPDVAIDAEVDVGSTGNAFGIVARLNISLPGMDHNLAQRVIEEGHKVCPYSRATRGNIDVVIKLL